MATGTGNLPNPSMSFSPFAILTAQELNDLVENIESTATGVGIGDGAITSVKLIESFFRGRLQLNTTNSIATGLVVQAGWGSIQLNSTPSATKAVTFPRAYTSAPIVLVGSAGEVTADGNSYTSTSSSRLTLAQGFGISTTGFTAAVQRTNDTNGNGRWQYFTWIAIGVV
jgi:hypothetical protein